MSHPKAPSRGERMIFENLAGGILVKVASVPEEQPLAAEGIFLFRDQNCELRICEHSNVDWVLLEEDELTPAQADKVWDILYPSQTLSM